MSKKIISYDLESIAVQSGGFLPNEYAGLDPDAFDDLIRARGMPLIHYRSVLCPHGLENPDDIHRTNATSCDCDSGFKHIAQGRLIATLTSNPQKLLKHGIGYIDDSTAISTTCRFYDSEPKREVYIRPFDRLYYEQEDLWVSQNQLLTRRLDGFPDRPEFPAIQGEILIDSNNVNYYQHVDYDLTVKGDVEWREGKGPDVGTVYSFVYLYRPYYVVVQLMHQLRLFQAPTWGDDEPKMVKMGPQLLLQREMTFRKNNQDLTVSDEAQKRQKLPYDEAEEES